MLNVHLSGISYKTTLESNLPGLLLRGTILQGVKKHEDNMLARHSIPKKAYLMLLLLI